MFLFTLFAKYFISTWYEEVRIHAFESSYIKHLSKID